MRRVRMWAGALVVLVSLAAGAARADETNPADAVVQRFIDASGGVAKLSAIHSQVYQSTMKAGWIKLDTKTTRVWPDHALVEGNLPLVGTHVTTGYDGTTAWGLEGMSTPRRLQGRELQEAVLGQRLDRMARLFELYPKRRLLPAKPGDNAPQVEMGTQFGTTEVWTFDPATGLLQSTEGDHDGGPKKGIVHIFTRFDDYRTVDGVTLPFRATAKSSDANATIVINSLQNNVPVDAAIFTPPQFPAPSN